VQSKLLDLYTSPYMSSSVKLHIIVALDQTTRLKEGLDWLLGRHHVQVASTSAAAIPQSSPGFTASLPSTAAAGDGHVKKEPVEEMPAGNEKEDTAAGRTTGYQRILNIMSTKQVVANCTTDLNSAVRYYYK